MHSAAAFLSENLGISIEYCFLIVGFLFGLIVRGLLVPRQPVQAELRAGLSANSARNSALLKKDAKLSIMTTSTQLEIPPQEIEKIVALLRSGSVIEAIKAVRAATNLGLAEAKSVVDALQRANPRA